jgi:YVTN family beta-propeller protein
LRKFLLLAVLIPLVLAAGWYYFHQRILPVYGPLYREYAYITNGKSNTVTVIDLRSFIPVRTLQVGTDPTGVAANPKRNEIYVVNSGSSNVTVIDAEQNKVVATIGVHGRPYFIDISPDGRRAYVANSGSANVSVIDLDRRAVIATLHVGGSPGLARVSPDGSTVVVSNRADNSVSIIDTARLAVRSAINICIHPEDIAILPDSSKAFVSCSGSGQVASIALKNDRQNDKLLALLDVGKSPVSLALKPDGGELAAFNFDAGSISIIETAANEVSGSYLSITRASISLTSDRITSPSTTSTWARSSPIYP